MGKLYTKMTFEQLMSEGEEVTLVNIKTKWFGISLERPRMLMEIFTQYNHHMKELVNKEFPPLDIRTM